MKFSHRLIVIALLLVSTALQAQIEVNLEPQNDALKENIEIHIGPVENRSARELRRMAGYVRDQARQGLRALGYYNPEIETEVLAGDGEEGAKADPRLRLDIEAGEPVRFRNITVDIRGPGKGLAAFQIPPNRIPNAGEQLDHSRYSGLKSFISDRARFYGFFDGQFIQQQLRVNPQAGTADVNLIYQSGERYTLGEVSFTDTPFKDELLRRFVQFEPGTPYQSDLVADLNQNLRSSGYFAQILVNAAPERAIDKEIPVNVELSEREPNSLGVGAGFSTDVGPRARLTWTQHWFNEHGHRRGAETEISAPRQTLGAWYEIPLDPPMTDSLRFTAGYQREDIEDIESQLLSIGGEWRHLTENDWQRVLSLEWQDERFEIGNDSEQSRLLLPGFSLDKLSSDDSIDPSRGYRLQLGIKGANRALLSTVDVAQVILGARGLTTLADNHRFLVRARAGAVSTNDFDQVPPSLRFFAGGDQSIRGYDYRSLGPTDADGDNLGGRYLLETSFEYQYEFIQRWRLAAFVDHGNAVESLDEDLKTGAGVGLRWVSPVGPLRLDIAQGLDDRKWRIHFSMGPEL